MTVSYEADYRNENVKAPFYWLIRVLRNYCHPSADAADELAEILQRGAWLIHFREQHRAALLDPNQLPDGAVAWAASYDDGDAVRYLRRLWRDLYPGEAVPGGDDEFREELRQLINGEVDRVPGDVGYYSPIPLPTDPDELKTLGRRIWERFYPDEPLP